MDKIFQGFGVTENQDNTCVLNHKQLRINALIALGEQFRHIPDPQYQALGFWLRESSVKNLAYQFEGRRTLGSVLQIAPANVDLIFMYPLILSLLAGNKTWVRVSERSLPMLQPLLSVFNTPKLDIALAPIKNRLVLFSCPHGDDDLKQLSKKVALRMMWGSDTSILSLRQQYPTQALDISFGHKHSLCLIAAKSVHYGNLNTLVERFIRDSFTLGQQACSSPKTILWLGNKSTITRVQKIFWAAVSAALIQRELTPLSALQRLHILQQLATAGVCDMPCQWNAFFARLPVTTLHKHQESLHDGQGIFFELKIEDLRVLQSQLRSWHQTLTFFGLKRDTLKHWVLENNLPGLDRIEPVGHALVFAPIWDGYNFFSLLSRELD